jgi:hypothetical protein
VDSVDAPTIPSWLTGFFDDAAVFPPASVPLPEAVIAHREHLSSQYASLVGSLVVPDVKLADLIEALDDVDDLDDQDDQDAALPVSVLVTGGAGAIGPAVTWASRAPHLELRSIDLALREEDDLAHNARRVLTALDATEEDLSEVSVFVELPRWDGAPSHGWLSALDEIAAGELFAKFRVGGAGADLFPGPEDVVTCLDAALDRELPFKITGGLGSSLPRPDEGTGSVHHGFLNLLVATRGCLEGADAVSLLRETSAEALLAAYDTETLGRTRQWLRGLGVPDLLEPHDELVDLGLL